MFHVYLYWMCNSNHTSTEIFLKYLILFNIIIVFTISLMNVIPTLSLGAEKK